MRRLTVMNMRIKEPISALSHFLGALLSIMGLVLLLQYSYQEASIWHIVSFAVFGVCAVVLYTFSTLYHWLPLKLWQEKVFRRLDHSAIYLMIAGTYTPICLVTLRGAWGWSILVAIWLMAFLGIGTCWVSRKTVFMRKISTAIYLGMGWFCVVALYPLLLKVPASGWFWLAGGGVAYSVGAVIYRFKKPNFFPRVFGFHEVFHLFVLLGTFCHFWFMFDSILSSVN